MRPLGIRRRLLLSIVAIVTAAVAALLLGFNVLLAQSLDNNARDLLRSRAMQQLALLRTDNGSLSFIEAPETAGPDANVWVFSNGKVLERSPFKKDGA